MPTAEVCKCGCEKPVPEPRECGECGQQVGRPRLYATTACKRRAEARRHRAARRNRSPLDIAGSPA